MKICPKCNIYTFEKYSTEQVNGKLRYVKINFCSDCDFKFKEVLEEVK
jgi:hypothetical protein